MSMFMTRAEAFAVGRAAVAGTPGIRLNPAVADIPGSDLNLVIGIDSVIGEEVVSRGASAMRGAFAETSRGAQLDRVAYDRYGLVRFSATPASVDLVLTRPLPGVATPGTYSAGSVVQTADGVQFGLDTDAVFGNFDVTVLVSATCTTVGASTNVAPSTVTAFSTSPFDATLTVNNPASAAGGTDTESDIQFLGRIRGFFPTVSRAILGAIEYGAKQVPGVAVATASEILNPSGGFPAGAVQLVIGDRNGNATTSMVTAVSDTLLNYRAAGIPVFVLSGVVVYQTVQWNLAFKAGFDEKLATSRVQAVTVSVSQFLPPGPDNGILYRASLISAAQQVPGVILSDASLVYPLGDVVPTTPEQMIRILSSGVTFV
jgi:uncharacterized phage protein gp47/JayE